MESGAKRRKVSHNGDAPKSKRSVAMATASPFVLQTEELLKEVKVDYAETFDGADALLKQIKHVIDGIAPQEAAPISDATRKFQKKHHIQIPFPDPKPAADAPYKLAYAKPAACNVVGSYVSRTMIQGQEDKCVDMIVQMPASLFQDKDFQTMRYFYRRAYYIANIAAGVREALGSSVDLLFENLNENSLLPILTILPKVESESLNMPSASSPAPPTASSPSPSSSPPQTTTRADGADAPTPFYNSTLKAEETFVTYLRVLTPREDPVQSLRGCLHPRQAHGVMVRRPSRKKEAARFRQFWGDKSELRRFKDGSILECVPWKQTSAAGICEEITRYVLKLHASVEESNIHFYGGKTPDGLEFTPVDKEAFDTARRAFQTMEHDLRSLEDLPLSIRRLAPVVPELRYASIQPPVIGFHKGTAVPMDVTLTFEASSKWPENVVAIQEAKIEFLLDIDRRLKAAKDNITTCLGRDNAVRDSDNLAFLDVVYENGAAFRLRVHSDPEETLLERQAKNKTLDPYVRLAAEETLHKIRWQNNDLPLHTQSIASFCTRLPALSPAIRMTKHWFNSHKLTGHISEELIELLVLHVFLRPHPWKIPSSAQSGFLRTLLFLSRWDWRTQPLVVDFSDDMSPADAALSQTTLAAWRARDPTMNHAVLFVATSHDPTGQSYTRTAPTKLSATRMTRLAKSAVRLVREQDVALEIDALFEPSLADYDFLLHLSSKETKRVLRDAAADAGARHSAFKNLDARTGKVPLPLARHPVDVLLGELEAAYEDSLIFFRGSRGDAVVGAIWQPKLRRQAFRVGLPFNFSAVGDGAEVEVNKEAVLLEIARIGGDMIKRIEVAE
ncbi:U3 small nucleolar RNA-associated protein [Verticillium alfalfae VaMs.102]|uniref:U3 small nucleolar RNA-associated protein 22 n=1 Tax=Verticillium alfalfae (strain VaMs.102 / ATCC MYA-4576 / FGSC 10136) TaxID=526221 RepID=C9SXW3_VERA1|nr:U3 small nucleolar RNA-associated protein [Verticillium alfalfae VaMs.102]EEY23628.1 U3 small nucleolar RNA-associated protein [Verticillium alfalfae VaMs.102]